MGCVSPIQAYRSKKNDGSVVFNTKDGYLHSAFPLACGQCYGCRLERSRVWAVRCMHEAQMYEHNQFVTLTYDDENLPEDYSIHKRDLQLFWKSLRKKFKCRYYACGEYGDRTLRPHYHAIIFGLRLQDKIFHRCDRGNTLYTSSALAEHWDKGHVLIGDVTFESCAYVARYIMKKQGVNGGKNYERWVDEETGEVYPVAKEFTTMSRRPGIGYEWYKKYKEDIYKEGCDGRAVIRGGKSTNSPRYYDNLFKGEHPANEKVLEKIKERRKIKQLENSAEYTEDRLAVKSRIIERRINKKLLRSLE